MLELSFRDRYYKKKNRDAQVADRRTTAMQFGKKCLERDKTEWRRTAQGRQEPVSRTPFFFLLPLLLLSISSFIRPESLGDVKVTTHSGAQFRKREEKKITIKVSTKQQKCDLGRQAVSESSLGRDYCLDQSDMLERFYILSSVFFFFLRRRGSSSEKHSRPTSPRPIDLCPSVRSDGRTVVLTCRPGFPLDGLRLLARTWLHLVFPASAGHVCTHSLVGPLQPRLDSTRIYVGLPVVTATSAESRCVVHRALA